MKTVDEALAFAERVYSRVSDAGIIAAEVRRLRDEINGLTGSLDRAEKALKDAAEKMRRCDYMQARSDMLTAIAKVEGWS